MSLTLLFSLHFSFVVTEMHGTSSWLKTAICKLFHWYDGYAKCQADIHIHNKEIAKDNLEP